MKLEAGAAEPQEAAADFAVPRPTQAQLRMLFLSSAVPFVGFGFLDNFLMIIFGEFIDSTLCVMFSLSTMAAAAIGNTISDCAGIFSGGAVESLARRCGVEEPPMCNEQRFLRVTKVWQYTGQCVGIIIGCTLGCCPLLWMDPKEGERLKREKARHHIFEGVIAKVQTILGAEAVGLLFVDKERRNLVCQQHTPNLPPKFSWPLDSGFLGHVVEKGQFVNIAEVQEEPLYEPHLHGGFVGSGMKIHNILCMPIFGEGMVQGAIVVLNKMSGEPFTTQDEDVLSAICSHISTAMGEERATFAEVVDACERSMRKTGAQEWSHSGASQRRKLLYQPALEGVRKVLGAEAATLMLLDKKSQELETEVIDGPLPPHRTAVGEGVVGQAVERGQTINASASDRSWYDADRHSNYQGTGLEVRSELVVPLFDTSRKCLGVIKCLNKRDQPAFSEEDVQYVSEVAHHLEMMLEGPDAGLRRVLALSRQRMQQKYVVDREAKQCMVLATLQRAERLPGRPGDREKNIDPYVTFSLMRGNPLLTKEQGLHKRMWLARNKDRKTAVRRFAKSITILEERDPQWNETIAVMAPASLESAPIEELYVHVLLWDYDALRTDDLVAQAAFPLKDMPKLAGTPEPYDLQSIPGQEDAYDLTSSKIWLSFARGDVCVS